MTMKTVLVLNGPNLDQLGTRDPAIYGSATLDDLIDRASKVAADAGWALEHLQTASEAELVARIHAARTTAGAIVINGGAFTHYSWSTHDALQLFSGPIIELHISQVASREPWRHTSVIAPVATALIAGLGPRGYEVAVQEAIFLADSLDAARS